MMMALAVVLAMMLFPRFLEWVVIPREGPVREPATRWELRYLAEGLRRFESDNGRLPTSEEGLKALVACPHGLEATWHRQMEAVPTDKWGRAYRYQCPGTKGRAFDLMSAGSDGEFGTADDISCPLEE